MSKLLKKNKKKINRSTFAAFYLDPLLLFHISFVCLGLVVLPSIFLIFTDTFEVVLVVITPGHHKTDKDIAL